MTAPLFFGACLWYPVPSSLFPTADNAPDAAAIADPDRTLHTEGQPRTIVPTYTPTGVAPTADATASSVPLIIPTPTPTITPPPTATPVLTGEILEARLLDSYSIDTINGLIAGFYPASNQRWAQYAVDHYQIRFTTTNEAGESIAIRSDLYVPRVDGPTPFPVFVYGAGTTGIGNECAPLDEAARQRNWGNYRTHMLSYAAQGYIGALPLWQGYDDPQRTHPYFISELEGYILLDATRALYNFFAQPFAGEIWAWPLDAVFYGGYSQGAHGAFAADKMAPWYAPELSIKGIIGHASAPSVEALLRERPSLAPYIVYAYREFYGNDVIDPADVFLPQWSATFDDDAPTKCVDEVYRYYPSSPQQMYQPAFLELLMTQQLGEVFPHFQQTLDMNYAATWTNTRTPALMLHGGVDPIVTQQTAEEFIDRLCQMGKPVTYYLYPGADHFVTRQQSFADTVDWMQAILRSENPATTCTSFTQP